MDLESSRLHGRATAAKGSLKQPSSVAFNHKEWMVAFEEIENPTNRDIALAYAAHWFGKQFKLVRRETSKALDSLTRSNAVILALAQSNREYSTMQRKMSRLRHKDRNKDFVDLQHAGQRPIRTGFPGNNLPADDLNDALIDTLPNWLYSANMIPEGRGAWPDKLTSFGMKAMRAFSFESTLGKLWQQALWLDWRLDKSNGMTLFHPNDFATEALRHAWLWRLQAIASQAGFTDIAMSRQAKQLGVRPPRTSGQTVIGIETLKGTRPGFLYGNIKETQASDLQRRMWESAVETSYLNIFLDAPLPKIGISCRTLHDVWCIIADIAELLAKKCSNRREITNSTVRDWALICKKEMLLEALSYCCGLTAHQAKTVVGFLTYDGSEFRRGLWSMPIVEIPNEPSISLCRSPIQVGNPIRRVEQWLERGGLTDQLAGANRGKSYEALVREEICSAIAGNKLLIHSMGLDHSIKPRDRSVGDIDAAFRLGNTIVVAEVKCLLTPSEPIEQYRYAQKLISAAKQARRKTDWFTRNFEQFRGYFQLQESAQIQIQPLVIVNQGFGHSLDLDGCLVCDISFLRNYLSDGKIITGAVSNGVTGQIVYQEDTYYNNETEASENLAKIISKTPTLQRYIDRIEWHYNLLPCFEPPTNAFLMASGRLRENISSVEKSLAQLVS